MNDKVLQFQPLIVDLIALQSVNNTNSGFSAVTVTKDKMTVNFINQDGTILYESSINPRSLTDATALETNNYSDLPASSVVVIVVASTGITAILIYAIIYFYAEYVNVNNDIDDDDSKTVLIQLQKRGNNVD